VFELVTDERKRLERQRHEEERLANGNGARTPSPRVEGDKSEGSGESTPGEEAANKVPTGPMPEVERGLCVVCQDEEATLAVVDCGHLCMCAREYSEGPVGLIARGAKAMHDADACRLLRPHHGDESGVSSVQDQDRHQATTHPNLPSLMLFISLQFSWNKPRRES
jgi:hypothetical protein